MKKKNTAKALLLSLGIVFQSHGEPNLISHISHSVEEIKTMTQTKATAQAIFDEVRHLAHSLNKLNVLIKSKLSHLKADERSSLLLVNQALSYGIGLIKMQFEDEIYNQFFNEFKALSSAKNTLEIYLRQIQEREDGIEIVKAHNLSLTKENLNEIINSRAK